jgi:glycosyltransferase involved in cell wall biosynthesis
MKICMINDEHYPFKSADTINVVRTASGLGAAGAQVDLLVPRLWGENLDRDALCRYYGVAPSFRLIRIPTPFPTSRTVRIEKLTHGLAAPWLSLMRGADVVYSRNFIPLLLAHGIGKPWVFETYRRFVEETPWLPRVSRYLPLDRALGAVVHSEMSARNLAELGFPRDGILTAYSGYLDEEVRPRLSKAAALRACGLDIDGPVVLHLGNVDPYIRLDWLLAPAARMPDVTFLFVGGYPAQQAHWIDRCAQMGVHNARFIPNQPPAEVRKYLYTADLLAVVPRNADYGPPPGSVLFPSLYSVLPGIPMKIFVYKASGIPIISPDLPYVREVLRHGENAFLAPRDSVDGVAGVLRQALDDRAGAKRVADRALNESSLHTWAERGRVVGDFIADRLAGRTSV